MKEEQEINIELEEPPGLTKPPHPWEEVPLAQWNDWRWQLSHRLNSVEDFAQVIRLTPEEVEGLAAPGLFRVDITPYFASLMDRLETWRFGGFHPFQPSHQTRHKSPGIFH